MHIAKSRIVPLIIAGAALLPIAAAPVAGAAIGATGVQVNQTTDNAQIVATPGAAAQQAAQLQEPFGGDMGALLFHHR
jgi:hypothetical protein